MRKLLVVLLLFLLSIISLILLFNTFTNTSKQTNIQLVNNSQEFPKAVEQLAQAIRISTKTINSTDSLPANAFQQFGAWLKKKYASVFNNPNLEWQKFEEYSLVGKWIGRTPELAPIIFVASQEVATPDLNRLPEWSYNPFMGKTDEQFIYGAGSQGGKAVMIALLEILNQLISKNTLPERTIYFVFPHSYNGEVAIINALQQAQIRPEFILKTGGLIAQDMLWDIESKVAMIGIGQKSIAKTALQVQNKAAEQLIQQEIKQLQSSLPSIDVQQKNVQEFLSYISPELGFGQRLVFSNQWLLNNIIQKRLHNNLLTQNLFSGKLSYQLSALDSNNIALANVTLEASSIDFELQEWIKSHLQHPQIQTIGQNQTLYNNIQTSPIHQRSYRVISNSCKEIFPNLITAPVLVNNRTNIHWQTKIDAAIYYFHPIVHNKESWQKAQDGIDEKISLTNYTRLVNFYHQLLVNNI